MKNSKFAINSIDEIASKMKKLEHSWEFFMTERAIPNTIRSAVQDSWRRCQEFGVDPLQQHSPITMGEDSLKELILTSNLYHASQPIIKDLYYQIKNTEHLITLSDDKGRIIHIEGESKVKQQAQDMNFTLGSDWSEQVAGSNAIGTALAAEQPIQIFSYEHYCEGVHPWMCSAAPIKDPLSQKVLGIIDLTGPSELAQPHSLMVVQYISNLIEVQLMASASERVKYLHHVYEKERQRYRSIQVVVVDEMLNVVCGDTNCFHKLQIDKWQDFWMNEQMVSLKKSLLNSKIDHKNYEHEWEYEISSCHLKVFIRSISFKQEQIGFALFIEPLLQSKYLEKRGSTVFERIIGDAPEINQLKEKVNVIAKTNVPVLVMGDSGTGKELISYEIHQASLRKDKPFIAINCGAIPENLIASELFGYERGTFTGGNPNGKIGKFEEADGGTLFLDEIGEMPINLQVHLLRVLQEKEIVRLGSSKPISIDVRIIAATNKNIQKLIKLGKFRSDLYFRLNVVELHIPTLKERKGDIRSLCNHFISHFSKVHGKHTPIIEEEVYELFSKYEWPGNIRELMNILEYALLFSDEGVISKKCLPASVQIQSNHLSENNNDSLTPLELDEKITLQELIIESHGNLSEVARKCSIARTTLYRKIKKYNLKY